MEFLNSKRMLRVRAKLTGLALLVASAATLTLMSQAAVGNFTFGVTSILASAAIALIALISSAMLLVGLKLLLYESERLVTLDTVRRRASKQATKMNIPAFRIVIYMCGIDGSGKTTQMNLIAKDLNERGLKFRRTWLRWGALISYPFLALCRMLGYTEWKTVQSNSRYAEHHFYKNEALSKVWTLLFPIDLFIHSIFRIRIPYEFGNIVLCDRFSLDALVDTMHETKNPNLFKGVIGRVFLSLVPNQSIIFLLDTDEKEAYNRKKDVPDVNYLKQRRELYLNLAYYFGIPVLSANGTIEEVHEEIVEKFLSHNPFWYAHVQIGIKKDQGWRIFESNQQEDSLRNQLLPTV